MRLYVGNLKPDFTDEELRKLFSGHGEVESASIVRDRYTEQSKGFAFVDMPSGEEAQAAIIALNGSEVQQRVLTVSPARPKEERSPGTRSGSGPSFRNAPPRKDKKGPSKRTRKPRR